MVAIDGATIDTLPDAELASVHGGPIASRREEGKRLVAEISLYRVSLVPAEPAALQHVMSGTVIIEARGASIAGQLWRKVVGVIICESGF